MRARLAELAPGVELLENLRFDAGEERNDPAFVARLVEGIDAYVDDAFGACHRAHASIVGPPQTLPSAMGLLLQKEVEVLLGLRNDPKHPFVAVLGGSNVQVTGPTGAFVVVVAGIVTRYGVDGLFVCTMMAGVMLVVMGLTGMGAAVRFIPRPVVVGFTNGIAVLIASTQLRDLFGIDLKSVPGDFWPRMVELWRHAGTFSPQATGVALVTLAIIVAVMRCAPRVPGSILALAVVTLATRIAGFHVETIGTRFGGLARRNHRRQRPEHWLLCPART